MPAALKARRAERLASRHARQAARAAATPGAERGAGEPRIRLDVDARRAQLVALGVDQFGTRAYDEISIDAIAKAAGISKGLLYHYFPTKRAFFAACVREAADRLVAVTAPRLDLDPLDALHAGLRAYLEFVRVHGRAYATLMRSGVDPEIAGIVDTTRSTFVDRLISGFEQAPLMAFPPSATPLLKVALRGWVGFAETASLMWVVGLHESPSSAPSEDQVRGLMADALLDVVRSSLAITERLTTV